MFISEYGMFYKASKDQEINTGYLFPQIMEPEKP